MDECFGQVKNRDNLTVVRWRLGVAIYKEPKTCSKQNLVSQCVLFEEAQRPPRGHFVCLLPLTELQLPPAVTCIP
jgi:hypothetical protein